MRREINERAGDAVRFSCSARGDKTRLCEHSAGEILQQQQKMLNNNNKK